MEKLTIKSFFDKLLNGVAVGIIAGLLPNAVVGGILKLFSSQNEIYQTILYVLNISQLVTPVLIGVLVAMQFKFAPLEVAITGMVSFIGAGSVKLVDGKLIIAGIGDLINTMIVAGLAVVVINLVRGKFGTLNIVLLPATVVTLVGTIGLFILPHIRLITTTIGNVITHFTTLQPLIMSILLAISFAIIIVSPVSTVAIAVAIGLSGLSSGAANLGVASAAATLVVGTMRVNKIGIPISIFAGSMKMFLPNWVKYPISNVPLILNAIFAGCLAYIFDIKGTAMSAGFGFSGLIGPLAAAQFMQTSATTKFLTLFGVYFVALFIMAIIIDFILVKVIKLYKHDIFMFDKFE